MLFIFKLARTQQPSMDKSKPKKNKLRDIIHDEICRDDYYYLYKYLPPSDDSLKIFENKTLKFTKPKDFNDPFEFLPFADEMTPAEIIRDHEYILKNAYALLPKGKGAGYLKQKPKLARNAIKALKSHREEMRSSLTVFCLTANPVNTLMWSHYAGNCKGFVVEFKFPLKRIVGSEYFIPPIPVRYSKKRENVPLTTMINPETKKDYLNWFTKLCLTKSTDWSYELEYRALALGEEEPTEIINFSKNNIISSVIFGPKTDSTYKDKLEKAIGAYDVNSGFEKLKKYHAGLHKVDYKIVVPSYPELEKLRNLSPNNYDAILDFQSITTLQ